MAFSWLVNGGDPNHLQVLGGSSKLTLKIGAGQPPKKQVRWVLCKSTIDVSHGLGSPLWGSPTMKNKGFWPPKNHVIYHKKPVNM